MKLGQTQYEIQARICSNLWFTPWINSFLNSTLPKFKEFFQYTMSSTIKIQQRLKMVRETGKIFLTIQMLSPWWVLILTGGVIASGKENKLRNFWWKISYKSNCYILLSLRIILFVFAGVELPHTFCSGSNGVTVFLRRHLRQIFLKASRYPLFR